MLKYAVCLGVIFLLILFTASPIISRGMPHRQNATPGESLTIPPLTNNKAFMDYFVPTERLWTLHTGLVGASFDNKGRFGTAFFSGNPICGEEECPSFETPENSGLEYLFAGALWIGGIVGNDTLVSVAADGWFAGITEFAAFQPGREFPYVSDRSIWTVCTDTVTNSAFTGQDPVDNRPHIPLSLRVANRGYAWTSSPENNIILYDMVITNIGDQAIEAGYVGFYFDADVYHVVNQSTGYADDLTGSLRDAGIAYIIDNDGDPQGGQFDAFSPTKAFAFKFLASSTNCSDTGYNWWISNGNLSLDYGPQPVDDYGNIPCDFGGNLGTPTGDPSKYCILSHPGWDFDQIRSASNLPGWTQPPPSLAADFVDGFDTRFLMSLGPFSLLPDSSVRFLYATFTGDAVHQNPDNLANLPGNPDTYLANLDFSHILSNAHVADSLAAYLLNPSYPVTGLYVQHNDLDSVVIEWDPWVFSGVEGNNVYLYEIPPDSLPYPGVAPPWIRPDAANLYVSVDPAYRYRFDNLEPYHLYSVSVANQFGESAGELCNPVAIQAGGLPPAPPIGNPYIFIQPGNAATLNWSEPVGLDIDYYNIYKFENREAAQRKFYPFYDTGQCKDTVNPKDSFFIDGKWYFYYAMTPYQRVEAGVTSFTEYAADSTVYVVTAVTWQGLETAFSADVTVLEIPPRTKDILVVTCDAKTGSLVKCDTITNFYSSILQGYDFDFYMYKDSCALPDSGYRLWRDMMPYRLVIVDGTVRYDVLWDNPFGPKLLDFEKYLWSQGTLAYFGNLNRLIPGFYPNSHPQYFALSQNFTHMFLGIDSVFTMGFMYYYDHSTAPYIDSIIGLGTAEGIEPSIPSLGYDSLRSPYTPPITGFWPANAAPTPAAFGVNEHGQVIHRLKSLYPSTSLVEGQPIGVMGVTEGTTAFSFGFHLWYMRPADARNLVDYLMMHVGTVVTAGTMIEPDTILARDASSPDPKTGAIYLGNLSAGYPVSDIDPGTIRINGVITPTEIDILDSYPGFVGMVLKAVFPLKEFILSYGQLQATAAHPFTVSGKMLSSGNAQLYGVGEVVIKTNPKGDVNNNDMVDVGDIVYLVRYIFLGGPAPEPMVLGDVNGDGIVSIGDPVYLVNYIFRGGPPPIE